ncbi:MAG: hypothetical protein QOH68_2308 [Nocardioidaceae bacterium]|nr:hypothetical protein [Nocardioidaceae bacterium]
MNTMRAVVQDTYGTADVLRLAQVDRPEVAANDVLVQVMAAGLDRGTEHLLTGKPYSMRIMGMGFRKPNKRLSVLDDSGTVAAVGSAVTRFAVGDEVFGISRGSFAEYAVAREDKLAAKPGNLTFEQAAVVPVSGLTALQALRDAGRVEAGQRVLVIGASGGVGSYAVQLAKAFGAHVTGVSSTAKTDLVGSLGADDVIDYTKADFADGTNRYDLIIDTGGNSTIARLRRALTPRGTLVIVGGEDAGKITGMSRQLRALVVSLFVGQRLTMQIPKENFRDLEVLTAMIEAGSVTPSIDRTYPLDDAADAVRHLVAGKARGKVAITI